MVVGLVLLLPVSAQAVVGVDGVGFWDLSRLGYTDGVMSVRSTPAQRPPGFAGLRAFAYDLPHGAHQGPRRWYTVDLHVVLTLRKDSGGGDVFVDGQTDGWDAAELELSVTRGAHGFTTHWNTFDLVDGARRGTESGRTIVIDERNYLVDAGVRPGLNTFAVRLEEHQRARVEALQILPDSGIGVTTLGVPTVRLAISTGNPTVAPGRTFTIGFRLSSSGAPVKQVAVYPTIDPAVLAFVGPTAHRYRQLHGLVRGSFEFKALKVAQTKIQIRVVSNADNQPEIDVGVRIDPATGRGTTAALGATAIGLLLFIFVATSRRSRQWVGIAIRLGSRAGRRAS